MMLATLAPHVVPTGARPRRSRQTGSMNVTNVTSPRQATAAMQLVSRCAPDPVAIGELVLASVRSTAVGVCSLRRDPLSGRTDVQWCVVRPYASRATVEDAVRAYIGAPAN